jgi:hypothetical protein
MMMMMMMIWTHPAVLEILSFLGCIMFRFIIYYKPTIRCKLPTDWPYMVLSIFLHIAHDKLFPILVYSHSFLAFPCSETF